MKKHIVICSLLLTMLLTLFSPSVFAEEEPAWSAAYRGFVLDRGFAASGQEYGAEDRVRFGLYDMDLDGVPELIAYKGGASRAEEGKYVYTFSENQIRFLGKLGVYEKEVFYAPGSPYSGLFDDWMQMGEGDARYASYQDGRYEETIVYTFRMRTAPDSNGNYEYDRKTDDDNLNQTAHNIFQTYSHVAQDANHPFVLPAPHLSEIESMGWDAFVSEYETRNAAQSALRYRIDRIDQSFSFPGYGNWVGYDMGLTNYYDKVELYPADTDAVRRINSVLEEAAEDFLSEPVASEDDVWDYPVPMLVYCVDHQSVYLNEDLVSICALESDWFGGDDFYLYDCFNYDLRTGEKITLPDYLGLSDEETKALVQGMVGAEYPKRDDYFQNTSPGDYEFYLDYAGCVHLVFDTGALGSFDAGHPDVLLDYTAKPQIVSQPEETVESGDGAVSLSVHCYGPDLAYAWEYSDDDGAQWVPADCAEPVLTIPAAEAVEGRLYRCTVMNSAGTISSTPVKLTAKMVKAANASKGAGASSEETGESKRIPVWAVMTAAAMVPMIAVLLRELHRRNQWNAKLDEQLRAQGAERRASAADWSEARFCPRCGAPRNGDKAFCTKCGNPFQ